MTFPVEPLNRQDERTLERKGRRDVKKKFKTLAALKIEYVSPESVFPNAYNPNRQDDREFELLLASMREDGFTQPVIVQRKTKEIVDGEHRWRAAQHLGLKEIPVVFVDMSIEQARISTLRHNRARGSEDVELTIKILQDLRELGALDHAVDSLQISDREMSALLADLPAAEAQAGEEFSQSWLPAAGDITTGIRINVAKHIESATEDAAAVRERIRTSTEAAGTEEEYAYLAQNSGRYDSILIQFTPAQLEQVLAWAGEKPAERIMRLVVHHLTVTGQSLGAYS